MMPIKNQVIRFIEALPGESTLDDILYQLYVWEEEREQADRVLAGHSIPTPMLDDTVPTHPTIQTMPKPR